jgi:hypothetical protein
MAFYDGRVDQNPAERDWVDYLDYRSLALDFGSRIGLNGRCSVLAANRTSLRGKCGFVSRLRFAVCYQGRCPCCRTNCVVRNFRSVDDHDCSRHCSGRSRPERR